MAVTGIPSEKAEEANREIYDKMAKASTVPDKVDYIPLTINNFCYTNHIRAFDKYFRNASNVLDIGCGEGPFSCLLSYYKAKVLGLDISEGTIEKAAAQAKAFGMDNVTFKNIGIDNSSFTEDFDLIMAFEVLEHLPDDKLACEKIYDALTPDGYFLLSVPSENSLTYRYEMKRFGYCKYDSSVGHARRYTEKSIISLMEDNGFTVIEYKVVDGPLRSFLFTSSLGIKLLKYIHPKIGRVIAYLDQLMVPLVGEASILMVCGKNR